MKCESCKTREVEIELPKNENMENGIWDEYEVGSPYKLCSECKDRLLNYALRPSELFNLVAAHGHGFYLHDDFYDYETGEAYQPDTEVVDADKFPIPTFDEVKNDPVRLMDYAFVQYFIEDQVIEELKKFNKHQLLEIVRQKVENDTYVKSQAYEITAKAIGQEASEWAKEQWANRKNESLLTYAELLCGCLQADEAFTIITTELEKMDETGFYANISSLLYLKSQRSLDWLEKQTHRIKNVTSDFGQIVASSQFSWAYCQRWLNMGRPLSLIALDALYLCTMNNYVGQSVWLQNLKPRLTDKIDNKTVEDILRDYLKKDSVPRTKNMVGAVLYNLSETA